MQYKYSLQILLLSEEYNFLFILDKTPEISKNW